MLFSLGTFDWQMFIGGIKDQIASEIEQTIGSYISNTANQIAMSAKSGWNSFTGSIKGWFTSDESNNSDHVPDSEKSSDEETPESTEPFLTPIILLHGRASNTNNFFGVETMVSALNDGYEPDSEEMFTDPRRHEIISLEEGLLGKYLEDKLGYEPNKNLFAFNYPNGDMVERNAKRLDQYIERLIADGKKGSPETAHYVDPDGLFATKDRNVNQVKFILIGHSMGGLVSRYYIENRNPQHVDKLITICTPHYGSGLATASDLTGGGLLFDVFLPCDVDLQPDSTLYGGEEKTKLYGINPAAEKHAYLNQTPPLRGNHNIDIEYYAIGGYDTTYPSLKRISNNQTFSVEFDVNSRGKYDFQNSINYEIARHSLAVTGEAHELELYDTGGDKVVDYMSQFAVRFNKYGETTGSQRIEKATLIITAGFNTATNRYHSQIAFEPLMHEAVVRYIQDGN